MRSLLALALALCIVWPAAGQGPDTLSYGQWGTQFQQPRWQMFRVDSIPTGSTTRYAVDTASMTHVSPNVWRVWEASLYSRLQLSRDNRPVKTHELSRWDVFCAARATYRLAVDEYRGETIVSENAWISDRNSLVPVVPTPGTVEASLIEAVCKSRHGL